MSLGTVEHLEKMWDDQAVSVDTETAWTDHEWERDLYGISIYSPSLQEGFYFPYRGIDPDLKEKLREFFATRERLVFHNAKFDLKQLFKEGFLEKFSHKDLEDTMLMSWVLNENPPHGLKELGEKYFGKSETDWAKSISALRKTMGWDNIPEATMAFYAVKDTEITWKLYEKLRPRIEKRNMDGVYRRELGFMFCLLSMEQNGVLIDREIAAQISSELDSQLTKIQSELGFDLQKPSILARNLFASPPEGLGLKPQGYSGVKSKTFPLGRPLMDEKILASYEHPVCDRVLEYRHIAKEKATYIDRWLENSSPDGRYFPYFLQHGTVTGRLSGNMQQVPRKGQVKRLLRAPVGYSLVELDYSQAELRLAALITGEASLKRSFLKNEDIHQTVATQLGIDRQLGKTVNFLILYGGGASKLAETAKISLTKANSVLREYHTAYPKIQQTMYKLSNQAIREGYVEHWTGRRRHLSKEEAHKAFNSVIQGGVAEIMKQTMIDLKYNFFYLPVNVVCQVHDSLWIEIPRKDRDVLIERIREVMEWPGREWEIPFPVDDKILYEGVDV